MQFPTLTSHAFIKPELDHVSLKLIYPRVYMCSPRRQCYSFVLLAFSIFRLNMEFELIDHQDWHTEEDFPADLSPQHALTHMGMYFAWAAQKQLLHPDMVEQLGDKLTQLQHQQLTGRDLIEHSLGKQLLLSFFNPLGRRFTEFYYADEEEGYGQFMTDYYQTLRVDLLPSLYHVANSPEAYAASAAQFDIAFQQWLNSLRGAQS